MSRSVELVSRFRTSPKESSTGFLVNRFTFVLLLAGAERSRFAFNPAISSDSCILPTTLFYFLSLPKEASNLSYLAAATSMWHRPNGLIFGVALALLLVFQLVTLRNDLSQTKAVLAAVATVAGPHDAASTARTEVINVGTPIRIFVVSFIHSGSSALTGLLEKSGAFVFHDGLSHARRNRLPTGPDNHTQVLNSKGYFERRWLTEYDNTLLVLLGSGGTNTCPLIPWLRGIPQPDGPDVKQPLLPQWASRELVQAGAHAMQALDDVAPRGVWVLKSPHLSFTLPVYRRLLGEVLPSTDPPVDDSADSVMPATTAGHTTDSPICVLIVRHPAAAARSCVRWNGRPFARSLALWEHYTLAGLHACR